MKLTVVFSLLLFAGAMLAGCGGGGRIGPTTKPADLELAQRLSAARATYDRAAFAEAAVLFDLALHRAELMDDPAAIADAAYNDGLCLVQTGDYNKAAGVLAEARFEAARAGATTSDIISLQADVERRLGHMEAAEHLADQVIHQNGAATVDVLRAVLTRGLAACAKNDLASARESATQAAKLIGKETTPAFAAGVEQLQGEILRVDHQPAQAAARFDREAEFLRRGKLYGDMVVALQRAGRAYDLANQPEQAVDRYFRAARSALAQHRESLAAQLLDQAAAQAKKLPQEEWTERIRPLRQQVSK